MKKGKEAEIKRPRGRPQKAESQKYVPRLVYFDPDNIAWLDSQPGGERSGLVRDALKFFRERFEG